MKTKHLDVQFNLKAIQQDGTFTGYASVFNVTDLQKDIILKGAFAHSLSNNLGNIKLLWQHKIDEPIGVFLNVEEDAHGLYVHGKLLLQVARAKEAYELLKSGAVNGLSIGYAVVEANIDQKTGVRMISQVDLFEISLVTFPANENAIVTAVKGQVNSQLKELQGAIDRAIGTLVLE